MKNLLSTLLLFCLLSCSKDQISEDVAQPATEVTTSAAISFKNDYININSFKAQPANDKVNVGFLTLYQKEVKTLEILKGTTPNSLCSIYLTDVNGNSEATLQYGTEDTNVAYPTVYYIVKYTLQNGDWGYTPMFTLRRH